MSSSAGITVEELHAFVDGVLPPEREAEVGAAIEKDPLLAAKVAAYRLQNQTLHKLYDPCLEEALPERFVETLERAEAQPAPARPKRSWRPWLQAAALAGVFVAGAVAGWEGSERLRNRQFLFKPLVQQAILAHQLLEAESPQDKHLIGVEGDVLPPQISGAEFGVPYRAPTLKNLQRFTPVAFRTVQGDIGPTAQVMYRNVQGQPVSLYIRPYSDQRGVPFDSMTHKGHRVLYWIDGPLAYVVVGRDIADAELLEVARAVYGSRAVLPVPPDGAAQPAAQSQPTIQKSQ